MLLVTACGHAVTTPGSLEIGDLRARAAASPHDPAAARELAIGELLRADGDPLRAEEALGRATTLSEDDAELWLLAGVEQYAHGQPSAAREMFLTSIEKAAAQPERYEEAAEVAAGALAELEGATADFVAHVEDRLTAVLTNLGPAARAAVADVLFNLAYRRGDMQRVAQIQQTAGCLTSWRVAGPIGPRSLLGFDQAHTIGDEGVMPDVVDLGVGRGERAVRTLGVRGCAAHLGEGPIAEGGTTYAEAFVSLEEAGTYTIRLETPNAVELHIDDQHIIRLDHRRHPLERTTFHQVQLSAGQHEIRVKVTTRHPNPILAVSLLRSSSSTVLPDGPLLSCYMRASMALGRGQTVAARTALNSDECEDASLILALRSAVSLSDPFLPSDLGRDQARGFLREAARDARLWFPRLQLARLDAAEGRDREAIVALRSHLEEWPEVGAFRFTLVEMLLGRGWDAQAEPEIARTLAEFPGVCFPIEAALSHAQRRDRIDRIDGYARQLVACDARNAAVFSLHLAARRWEEATTELERLLSLEPAQAHSRYLSSRLDIAEGTANEHAIQALLNELGQARPRSAVVALGRVDERLAAGDREGALAILGASLSSEPAAMADLRRVQAALGGTDALSTFRMDGRAIIEEFERSGVSYAEPQLLLFDYMAARVFEDGSSLVLTHQIYKAQSEESVDDLGQFEPPDGGYILTLRTIKSDGTVLEPEIIDGTGSINLPTVSVGDYVESEYVRVLDPPAGIPGGILGDRFYFANVETPFHRSEYVVAVPESMSLLVDPRGDAPQATVSLERAISSSAEGVLIEPEGLRVYRWRVDQAEGLVAEPAAIDAREYIASIGWGVEATWPKFFEGLRDVLADRSPSDPVASALARRIARGAESEPEQVERLFTWVLANVENNSNVFGVAPTMLAARRGNRSRVLHYLMSLLAIDAELVLARGWDGDQTRSELADEATYSNLLVRYGDVLLMTGARGIPFGYVSPAIRDQEAVVLWPYEDPEEVRRFTLPSAPEGSERHTVDLLIDVQSDGSAHIVVTEIFEGAGAISWRTNLEGIPEAVLESRFEEAYVAHLIPGAHLTALRITGKVEASVPLVLHYEVDVAHLLREQGDAQLLPGLFPATLAPTLASLGERTTTQLVGPPLDLRTTITIRGAHLRSDAPSTPVRLPGPSSSFEMTLTSSDDSVVIERALSIPMMRVSPEHYSVFAQWVREVDAAEAREVPLVF